MTTQQLFSSETRENNTKLKEFMKKNMDDILHLFYDLYEEVDPADLNDETISADNNAETNFFEMRELMKLEYQILQDYKDLRDHFSNKTEYLK